MGRQAYPLNTPRLHQLIQVPMLAAGLALALGVPGAAQMPALPQLAGTPAPSAPANPNQFIFVVAGDNRPAKESVKTTATFRQIFTEIGAMNPKPPFVALLGDIIYGKDTSNPKLISAEYGRFLKVIQSANVTVYNAPGNHEMDAKGDVPSANMQAWYSKHTQSLTYGAFTYGNSRFIALNTDDLPGAGDCAGSGAPAGAKKAKSKPDGDLSQAQLSQLAAELEADKAMTNVFILMHRPIYAQKSSSQLAQSCRDQLLQLFAQYPNVRYVMASHEHLFYQPSTTQPPPPPSYVVSGGAGAPLATGGYYNYLVFTVNGDQVTFEVRKPGAASAAK
ncbi:MAG TPA: metallophosphoesterase [Thermoanaerobaculia bacterium]|jgi:hypothetical protein|nr:metallophosphoesterase [Thermoanaerobaculia bacterium]